MSSRTSTTAPMNRQSGDTELPVTTNLLSPSSSSGVELDDAKGSVAVEGKITKIIMGAFAVIVAAAIITIIVMLSQHKDSPAAVSPTTTPTPSTAPPTPASTIIPCLFHVPYTNWVDYGLNGTNVTCSPNGTPMNCTNTSQCHSISAMCVPGTSEALECVDSVCQVPTTTMPSFSYEGGMCDITSSRPVCALCTSGACQGISLCVRASDCNNTKLAYDCYPAGHTSN